MAGPMVGMAPPPAEGEEPAPAPAAPAGPPTEYTDMWGVTYQANAETNWQAVP